MKKRKLSLKTFVFGLFFLFLSVTELVAEFGSPRRATGLAAVVFVVLVVIDFWDSITSLKRDQAQEEGETPQTHTPLTDATTTALGGLDWMLHKINPGYDPDAERNARKADPAAIAKLDEMKKAGLIDEKEYQQRKQQLIEK